MSFCVGGFVLVFLCGCSCVGVFGGCFLWVFFVGVFVGDRMYV